MSDRDERVREIAYFLWLEEDLPKARPSVIGSPPRADRPEPVEGRSEPASDEPKKPSSTERVGLTSVSASSGSGSGLIHPLRVIFALLP